MSFEWFPAVRAGKVVENSWRNWGRSCRQVRAISLGDRGQGNGTNFKSVLGMTYATMKMSRTRKRLETVSFLSFFFFKWNDFAQRHEDVVKLTWFLESDWRMVHLNLIKAHQSKGRRKRRKWEIGTVIGIRLYRDDIGQQFRYTFSARFSSLKEDLVNDYMPVGYYVVKDIPKVLKYSILYRLYAEC